MKWQLESAHGPYEQGAAKEVKDHYLRLGWQAKMIVRGEVIEVWVRRVK